MSEEILVKYGAPTLAGIKTGNLISCSYTSKEQIISDIRNLNKRLKDKGIRLIPMRFFDSRALVYVYRPDHLRRDFSGNEVVELLEKYGYPHLHPEKCIVLLADKMKKSSDFPHEIGLFLSYPPEDVKGFIENKPGSCKCTGCWKVYGDCEKAAKTFAKYQKCTDIYCKCHRCGTNLEKLTISS